MEGSDSSESRHKERLLRAKAERCEQDMQAALISAKGAEIKANRTLRCSIGKRLPETEIHGFLNEKSENGNDKSFPFSR